MDLGFEFSQHDLGRPRCMPSGKWNSGVLNSGSQFKFEF